MKTNIKRETKFFGLPCSPAKFESSDIEEITEILLTFGGGMGGSHTEKYGEIESVDGDFLHFVDIFGEKSTLNKKYIVSITKKQLVTCVFDRTEHANYRNNTCKSYIETTYSIVNQNVNIEFVDRYKSDTRNPKSFYSNEEIVK